jgi:hypothetical protein
MEYNDQVCLTTVRVDELPVDLANERCPLEQVVKHPAAASDQRKVHAARDGIDERPVLTGI